MPSPLESFHKDQKYLVEGFSMAGFYEEALGKASFKLDCTEFLTIKEFEKRELLVGVPPAMCSRWN